MDKKFCKVFKALGEPTRLKIVKLLSVRSMCVCELAEVLNMVQPRISQHLRILKEAEIVKENREGYYIFYILEDEKLCDFLEEFNAFLEAGLQKIEGMQDEYRKFENLDEREQIKRRQDSLGEKA